MSVEASIDPRTGRQVEEVAATSRPEEVAAAARAAERAAPGVEQMGRAGRAALLRALGTALENSRERITAAADRETALGPDRLNGELTRTVAQAEHFADVLEEGSYLEAAVDHADGPGRPDLRRMLVPLGPVAVFGASNFPLAFSVPGGDTVSALAAGCPVVVKAHESHPATSELVFRVMAGAARQAGAPEGVLGLVRGREAGGALVADPRIKAVGFTGSAAGGRALMDIAAARAEPIPFYGELSGINPVVVTRAAARGRAAEIAAGVLSSVTGSGGQLCTKPGLVFVPAGAEGDALAERVREGFAAAPAAVLLNERVHGAYTRIGDGLAGLPGMSLLAEGETAPAEGYWAAPRLLTVAAADLTAEAAEECFGPLAVLVRYTGEEELRAALRRLPPSLSAALHTGPAEEEDPTEVAALTALLRAGSGRLVFGGFPTGVRVSWAQNHGGPWPSTSTVHTSVGATAIRRFLRPFTWQDAPESVLPSELRDGDPLIPRRVNGRLVLPAAY
ncbi:aldehyde dehydrogenase family protein [Streptomonospora sp. S1-112]|uniref:Aldehyde dehydrogenase family protein n=1 Tax=Streptomonospora mangrovi TaxID=2883123 RepID=A0A9X3NPR1_9ACTN|nr:aldehyde dehydrogenase family protein [Streptomonospora mangrovi]MDA0564440.1 aldehyde dehydrogenase family protein [Streptomonospora mangrovi]